MKVERPAPFFQKRNATRIVVRNRNRIPSTTANPTTIPTTNQPTEIPKTTRKTLRRKVTRTTTTQTQTSTQNYEQFSEGIDDEIAGVLPALLTSAKPRKPLRPVLETTTRALKTLPPNQFAPEQKSKNDAASFDKLLQQQYKIKGLDINDEDSYEEDERLIGVLGSQV